MFNISSHQISGINFFHQISSPMLEAFLLSRRRCCLPVHPDLCRGASSILNEITQDFWTTLLKEESFISLMLLSLHSYHSCLSYTIHRVGVAIVDSLVRYQSSLLLYSVVNIYNGLCVHHQIIQKVIKHNTKNTKT